MTSGILLVVLHSHLKTISDHSVRPLNSPTSFGRLGRPPVLPTLLSHPFRKRAHETDPLEVKLVLIVFTNSLHCWKHSTADRNRESKVKVPLLKSPLCHSPVGSPRSDQ